MRNGSLLPIKIVLLVVAVSPRFGLVLQVKTHHWCKVGHRTGAILYKHHLVSQVCSTTLLISC